VGDGSGLGGCAKGQVVIDLVSIGRKFEVYVEVLMK